MWNVEFVKWIKTSFGFGSKTKRVSIKTTLPFVPIKGMSYMIGTKDNYVEIMKNEVEEVSYYQMDNSFKIWCGTDDTLSEIAKRRGEEVTSITWEAKKEDVDKLLEEYKGYGWEER